MEYFLILKLHAFVNNDLVKPVCKTGYRNHNNNMNVYIMYTCKRLASVGESTRRPERCFTTQ